MHKDKKYELNLINFLEHLHVRIEESYINDPKPVTSSHITKPSTQNKNRVRAMEQPGHVTKFL